MKTLNRLKSLERLKKLRKLRKSILILLSCMLTACSLFACKGVEITGKTENVEGYSEAEALTVLFSERNRYQNILGSEIWQTPLTGQQEATYGPYFVTQVKEFLQDIKTLNLLAEEKGIIATSTEMELVRKVASEFYDGLTEQDKAAMGNCTIKDVTGIYTEYFVACKTAEYLLSNVDSEVSDADAKIITVQQIVVSDQARAEQLLASVRVEGANFEYYARQNSEDPNINVTLAKSEKEDAYYTAAFALQEGEISDIVQEDGKFYIIKCINGYDEAATLERKKRLEQSIRSNAFLKSYGEFAGEHIVRFREDFWKSVDITASPESTADNFFTLFDEKISF